MVPKILIFGKVWEWVGLVWKMLGDLGGVFWSYGEAPSSHIIKNPKNGPKNIENTILPYFSVYFTVWGLCWGHLKIPTSADVGRYV